jgi:RNA polymerase sigma factor (sigma-70 family)
MRIYKRKIYPVDNQRMRFEPFKSPKGYIAIRKIKQNNKDAIFKVKENDYKTIFKNKISSFNLDDNIFKNQLSLKIIKALSLLTPREERIIRSRFGIGVEAQTCEEIGNVLYVCKDRISQIEHKALRKLRHNCYGLKQVYKQLAS